MFGFLKDLDYRLFERYRTLERNIKSASNSFYDSYLDLQEQFLRIVLENEGVEKFHFGHRGQFNALCLKLVSGLKREYPTIRVIYVRAEYPEISKWMEELYKQTYDDTFMPKGMENAGVARYVERNQGMINASDFCVFYYDENYLPPRRKLAKRALFDYQPKSGTRLAYEYAKQKKKTIINLCK